MYTHYSYSESTNNEKEVDNNSMFGNLHLGGRHTQCPHNGKQVRKSEGDVHPSHGLHHCRCASLLSQYVITAFLVDVFCVQ